jgi:pentose-5-phosphate-3-epimerase
MANIVPAILGETFAEIKEKLEKIQGLSDWVQIDIADGVFAEPITWI